MKLESLVRFPIKGLGPDMLRSAQVESGGAIRFDREYAIAHGSTDFDPAMPTYLAKHHFLMLMRNPPLASLKTSFQEAERRVRIIFPDGAEIDAQLDDAEDRERVEAALSEFIGEKSRGGPPRIVSARNHRFFDVPQNYLSLINLASISDLEKTIAADLDPIRFRANMYISGLPAWEEATYVGREFICGAVRLRVAKSISRCAATSVNPNTAEVDVNVPLSLRKHYGTLHMGLYLEVVDGGQLETGAAMSIKPNISGEL